MTVRHRLLYEINTAHWLADWRRKLGVPVTLAQVPTSAWDAIREQGADAVWLMGVWKRSHAAAEVVRTHPSFANDRAFLPDAKPEDIAGSAFAVADWSVEPTFGGEAELKQVRRELAKRGMALYLDWVPNHVAPDHPWAVQHPEWCIRGSDADLERDPVSFIRVGKAVLARGRDPFFPAWADTVQLDPNAPGLRRAAGEALARIATLCDGVRCDMAMLLLPDVVERTWGGRASPVGDGTYWSTVLAAARKANPGLTVLAEAYWHREADLIKAGFDGCYDKDLYDALVHHDAHAVRHAINATPGGVAVRFLENHDEPRATSTFPLDRLSAAAVVTATLPGTWLFHAGQEHGHRQRSPVTLMRGAHEPLAPALARRWSDMTRLRTLPAFGGTFAQAPCHGWSGNPSTGNLLAWTWTAPEQRLLAVINYSQWRSQGRVRLPWNDLSGREVLFDEPLDFGRGLLRDGDDLTREGLYVDLAPWSWHVLTLPGAP
jgi:hypothetical protein